MAVRIKASESILLSLKQEDVGPQLLLTHLALPPDLPPSLWPSFGCIIGVGLKQAPAADLPQSKGPAFTPRCARGMEGFPQRYPAPTMKVGCRAQ